MNEWVDELYVIYQKFAGAVTHVFVQDSATGYGIFAETMLEQNRTMPNPAE